MACDHRSEVQTDWPALGPLGHRSRQVVRDADTGFGEDLLDAGHVQGQVAPLEFYRVARRAQPRQVGLLEPARRGQLGAFGYPEIATPRAS